MSLGIEEEEDRMTAVGNFDLKFEWVIRCTCKLGTAGPGSVAGVGNRVECLSGCAVGCVYGVTLEFTDISGNSP